MKSRPPLPSSVWRSSTSAWTRWVTECPSPCPACCQAARCWWSCGCRPVNSPLDSFSSIACCSPAPWQVTVCIAEPLTSNQMSRSRWKQGHEPLFDLTFQAEVTSDRCLCPIMLWAPLASSWSWRLCHYTVSHTLICQQSARVLWISCHCNASPLHSHRFTRQCSVWVWGLTYLGLNTFMRFNMFVF